MSNRKRVGSQNMHEEWSQILLHGKSIEDRRDVSDAGIKRRLTIMSSVMLLLFAVLGIRLFSVQIVSGQEFQDLANGNRIREVITYAPRGKILDRNGRILADNSLTFQLTVTPYLLARDDDVRERDFQTVAKILDMKMTDLVDTVTAEGIEYVLPLSVAEQVPHEAALRLESALSEIQGFSVDQVPTRTYSSDFSVGHIVGYSGRVSEQDIEEDTTGLLLPTDQIGKTGVELSFDDRLRGVNGALRYEVDALGRPVRLIEKREPQSGEDIFLSIDYEVQKTMATSIEAQMKKSKTKRASGVAVDPITGELLALVSLPDYDTNLFTNGIGQKDFDALNNNPNQPLFNKAVGGGFPTGSIIKPLVASAALQENIVTPNTVINDTGAITLPGGFTFLGWRLSGLGPMNARSALAMSSNIYFYTVGGGYGGIEGLGEERLTYYYQQYGLGEETGIELPGETLGRVPDEEWKLENLGEPWYQGDSYNISIGQGDLLVSPLQITMAEAAIANNGKLLTPQIERRQDVDVRREIPVDAKHLQVVREGMRQVLTAGTTCECTFDKVPAVVAGKSGTAETNTPGGKRPNAWFTAYAPYDSEPEILATVLIEEGEGGSVYAAPAIAATFKTYFEDR